ncbi:MAG: hypothetical protein LBG11_11820 [Bifidobacteriaceae bacterium]|nr:hypothetical protein [Bifidobacteriaceae bacterium]
MERSDRGSNPSRPPPTCLTAFVGWIEDAIYAHLTAIDDVKSGATAAA